MGDAFNETGDLLWLRGGEAADVRTGRLRRADVEITGGRIAGVYEDGAPVPGSARVIDLRGRVIVPGYIEPHTHFSIASPAEYAGALLRRGTTTAVVDALPLMHLAKPERLSDLLLQTARLPMRIRHLIRLHPQAFGDEDRFHLDVVRRLWRLPVAAAAGEVTRWVDVAQGDPDLRAKIRAAREDGRPVDGHAPGASYDRLVALARAGITSCHEAITAAEVEDRLRAGLAVMLRHSSIRPDLPELLNAVQAHPELLDEAMLTVDGPTPLFVEDSGYLDLLIGIAMAQGVLPLRAYRMATLNPARYFGFTDAGEIAPGKRADLNVLADLTAPTPVMTIAGGRIVAEHGRLLEPMPPLPLAADLETLSLPRLPESVLVDSGHPVPGIRLVNDVITEVVPPAEVPDGALHAALVDRHGRWITRARLLGFADRLGGLATTYSCSFREAVVVGDDAADMATALARLAEDGGGVVVVEDGREVFRLPFEHRLYSGRPWAEVVEANRAFDRLMRARGYRFRDPLFTLLFLSFDSLPWVRLTSRGVWDVRARRVLVPPAPL
ncbi:MAG: adenine deaminase C-terminal domain-containing protein [Armatimonadota bacterium]|nr:adenine deaminase C-terminal domain-containing protein [Armatimonadota bacterium]MDR7468103.1 adenine deaminase C-terminal domain-containing protein [Armatimonadota bacterium]MDR7494673.1 adenine deaminase C-terminal domain-containing protein [Armatimonadota bacterium]MDR7500194.1 adenine deaminase C-terminal domain-containing protein [Armatimonadota bacterium]MDR7505599.1 adenine deaminase C-terminal domain-containing protein [Armatimonadota bacterium]